MPSENKGQVSKTSALEPLPNPRPTASNTPTPLGTLSTLPRELRDEIYGHVHSHIYYLSVSPHKPGLNWWFPDKHKYGLPMMTVSKAIRQEFLSVLFGEAVFVLKDNVELILMPTWKRKEFPFMDQILNVRYKVPILPSRDMPKCVEYKMLRDRRKANEFMSERSATPLELVTGTEVLRNSCSTELESVTVRVMPVLGSPLIMAIKNLTGFKIVTVKFTMSAWRWWGEDTSISKGGNLSDADFIEEFKGMANAFRSALKPSLGPSLISEGYDRGLTWELTFRPREHVANRNKVKVISSSSGDEGNGSFPQVGSS